MKKYVGGLVLESKPVKVGEQTQNYLTFANNRDAESHSLSIYLWAGRGGP